jgi:hypothetical protein
VILQELAEEGVGARIQSSTGQRVVDLDSALLHLMSHVSVTISFFNKKKTVVAITAPRPFGQSSFISYGDSDDSRDRTQFLTTWHRESQVTDPAVLDVLQPKIKTGRAID